jgi:hypothetical protein
MVQQSRDNPDPKTSYQMIKSAGETQATVHKASILTLKRLKQPLNPAKFKVSSIKLKVTVTKPYVASQNHGLSLISRFQKMQPNLMEMPLKKAYCYLPLSCIDVVIFSILLRMRWRWMLLVRLKMTTMQRIKPTSHRNVVGTCISGGESKVTKGSAVNLTHSEYLGRLNHRVVLHHDLDWHKPVLGLYAGAL